MKDYLRGLQATPSKVTCVDVVYDAQVSLHQRLGRRGAPRHVSLEREAYVARGIGHANREFRRLPPARELAAKSMAA